MKTGKTLIELATEVQRQTATKVDLVADTRNNLRMVQDDNAPTGTALVTLNVRPDGEREVTSKYEITDNAHRQIASWLNIPWTYYSRLVKDHRDLVTGQVNALFEREPGMRMVRTLDGKARAFLSNRYKRLDNDTVLAKSLPALIGSDSGLPDHQILASHIDENDMRLRVVWTDPSLAQDIGPAPHGTGRDIVYPGFEIGNSETGRGSLFVRGFFYRTYCKNGCVFGVGDNAIEFRRTHIGGKLATAGLDILSDATRQKDDEAILSVMTDIMRSMGSRDFVQKMGDTLRSLRDGETMQNPVKGVQVLGKDLGLRENELDDVLKNLLTDGDLSRWGMLNAITALANEDKVTQERAFELEEIGSNIITLPASQWKRISQAEKVAA